MNEIDDLLCRCIKQELGLFQFFKDHELSDMPCYFSLRHIPAGQTIWHEGDTCDYMAFISTGHIEVKKETQFKGKYITLGIYGPGSIAGELCILDHQRRAVTATAIEDVLMVLLTHGNFNKLLLEHPFLGIKLLKGMSLTSATRLKKSFDRLVTIF